MELPPFASAPGVRSYTMSLLALQLLAIRMAEVRGRITMDVAFELRRELASSAEIIEQAFGTVDETAGNWQWRGEICPALISWGVARTRHSGLRRSQTPGSGRLPGLQRRC